tara:strand:- start:3814 stop:4032 length:219 start_codon:yes stop_codon:yes gene_type:complete
MSKKESSKKTASLLAKAPIFSWFDIYRAVDGIEDKLHVLEVLDQIVGGRIDDGVEASIYGDAQEESETIQRM